MPVPPGEQREQGVAVGVMGKQDRRKLQPRRPAFRALDERVDIGERKRVVSRRAQKLSGLLQIEAELPIVDLRHDALRAQSRERERQGMARRERQMQMRGRVFHKALDDSDSPASALVSVAVTPATEGRAAEPKRRSSRRPKSGLATCSAAIRCCTKPMRSSGAGSRLSQPAARSA